MFDTHIAWENQLWNYSDAKGETSYYLQLCYMILANIPQNTFTRHTISR